MDPNETLRVLRRALQDYGETDAAAPIDAEVADELYVAANALDTWLSRGGFLPQDWAPNSSTGNCPCCNNHKGC